MGATREDYWSWLVEVGSEVVALEREVKKLKSLTSSLAEIVDERDYCKSKRLLKNLQETRDTVRRQMSIVTRSLQKAIDYVEEQGGE